MHFGKSRKERPLSDGPGTGEMEEAGSISDEMFLAVFGAEALVQAIESKRVSGKQATERLRGLFRNGLAFLGEDPRSFEALDKSKKVKALRSLGTSLVVQRMISAGLLKQIEKNAVISCEAKGLTFSDLLTGLFQDALAIRLKARGLDIGKALAKQIATVPWDEKLLDLIRNRKDPPDTQDYMRLIKKLTRVDVKGWSGITIQTATVLLRVALELELKLDRPSMGNREREDFVVQAVVPLFLLLVSTGLFDLILSGIRSRRPIMLLNMPGPDSEFGYHANDEL